MKIPRSANLTTSQPSDGGFTLIELLMALLILTVGLLGLLQSVGIAYEQSLRKRLREEAAAVAEAQLNEMRQSAQFGATTTVTQAIGGVIKEFRVIRKSEAVGGSTRKLTVAVRWNFKNMTTTHEIYTLRKL